jgi:hypothetical protein
LRGEIWFNATIDEHFGVNFTKKNVVLNDKLEEFFKPIIAGQIKAIRGMISKQVNVKNSTDIDHEVSSKLIDQKSSLLIKPKPLSTSAPVVVESNNTSVPSGTTAAIKVPNCRFEIASMGSGGLIYDSYLEGKTVVITWNIDHPFYSKFIVEQKLDQAMITAVDSLIYSIAAAELMVYDEENGQLFNNIRSMMSSNMRTLLT